MFSASRRTFTLSTLLTLAAPRLAVSAISDPLPSWRDGAPKQTILDFVAKVTRPGPNFVDPARRVATFDNDGTLWVEHPIYTEASFSIDRARQMAASDPSLKSQPGFAAASSGSLDALTSLSQRDVVELVTATHGGMTPDAFRALAVRWLASARHPRFQRPYTSLAYRPQLELLEYLRANGFKTFIVSGGGVEFMRTFTERVYGVPPEQVLKTKEIRSIDDGSGKPENIELHIGRRPILAFGNSDGDVPMLEYVAAGSGPHLEMLVHHDDAAREYAYDRDTRIGRLDKGLDEAANRGWTVVSMKNDWATVFPV